MMQILTKIAITAVLFGLCDMTVDIQPCGPRMCDTFDNVTTFYPDTLTCTLKDNCSYVAIRKGRVKPYVTKQEKEGKIKKDAVMKKGRITKTAAEQEKQGRIKKITVMKDGRIRKTAAEQKKRAKISTVAQNMKFGKYGVACYSRKQCDFDKGICLYRRCHCVIGYSFNFTLGYCVKECVTYGEMFSEYTRTGFPNTHVTVVNVEDVYNKDECIDLCRRRSRRTFTCISADFQRTYGRCRLCTDPNMDFTGVYGKTPKSSLFYRNCQN